MTDLEVIGKIADSHGNSQLTIRNYNLFVNVSFFSDDLTQFGAAFTN